ncbi:MAG: 2-oxoacid:ferredoxin oxidoreductase subunit beta, partial [Caulobacteraceae bacterium]
QFNNHAGSTKSFDYVREHNQAVNRLDVIEEREEIVIDYEPGAIELVTQHDGSVLKLRKLAADYDPTDKVGAVSHLMTHEARGEIVTGLIFIDPEAEELHDYLGTVAIPLNQLSETELTPDPANLARINQSLR